MGGFPQLKVVLLLVVSDVAKKISLDMDPVRG
jgi:hypothetical protein